MEQNEVSSEDVTSCSVAYNSRQLGEAMQFLQGLFSYFG